MDYNNPTALKPQIGWAPEGFLAGQMYGQQQDQHNTMLELAQLAQAQNLQRQQAQNQDFNLAAPARAAERNFQIQKNNVFGPIQSALAGAESATAQGTIATAPSATRATIFKNKQMQQAVVEQKMGDLMNAILTAPGDATEKQRMWQEWAVPQLERDAGEPLPQQFRVMTPEQMSVIAQALTLNAPTRQRLLEADLQGGYATDVARIGERGRIGAARIAADQRDGATTMAEFRMQRFNDLKEGYKTEYLNRHAGRMTTEASRSRVMTEAEHYANQKATREVLSFEPVSRADANAQGQGAQLDNARLNIEKLQADRRPIPANPDDREDNVLYRNASGEYARWIKSANGGQGGWQRIPGTGQ